MISRRHALGVFAGTSAWLIGCRDNETDDDTGTAIAGDACGGIPGGTFVRAVPFENEGPAPLDVPIGSGLDGRLYDDLSSYAERPFAATTPTGRFYVRTRIPDRLDPQRPWQVRVEGLVEAPVTLGIDDVTRRASPRGVHLLECSGNGGGAFFGMISTAAWDGVPLADLLDAIVTPLPGATRVLVNGFDDHSMPSERSTPGASWIFRRDELRQTGAFLATGMNGAPLEPDHGRPVRLVVPGWYGCTCIKWVDGVRFVGDDAPATAHMKEFASRTMQSGAPELARDYAPAVIDPVAMPVRVEEWRLGDRRVVRVIGIAWGGARPFLDALRFRLRDGEPFVPVATCAAGESSTTWSWWSCAVESPRPGPATMRLRVDDATVRTRPLDSGYYARTVVLS